MLRHTAKLAVVLTCMALAIPIAFSQAVSFTTSSSPYLDSLHADFNSDGREDFINSTGCSNSSFGLALSTGDGTYAAPVCYTLPHGAPAYYFAIGDFNRFRCACQFNFPGNVRPIRGRPSTRQILTFFFVTSQSHLMRRDTNQICASLNEFCLSASQRQCRFTMSVSVVIN